MLNLGVLVSGGGTNLQAIIDSIEAGSLKARISVVICSRAGAHALERAKDHDIEAEVVTKKEFPEKADYDRRLVEILKTHGVELIALAGFMRILTPTFIRAFPGRIMNIHPSLLPAFPGLDVQRKAIEYGARFTGATVHFVDEGVDTGPVIIQAALPILPGDTPESLSARILKEEHRIYPEAISLFAHGRLEVRGRSVSIKDARTPEGALHNPRLSIKKDET